MSDSHRGHIVPTDTDSAQTTVSDIRTALTQRARLGDDATVRTVIVDAAGTLDIPEARAAREFVRLHKNGFVYTVGDGAEAEVRLP
jgi:hypothetical protein